MRRDVLIYVVLEELFKKFRACVQCARICFEIWQGFFFFFFFESALFRGESM